MSTVRISWSVMLYSINGDINCNIIIVADIVWVELDKFFYKTEMIEPDAKYIYKCELCHNLLFKTAMIISC